jgi:hypothetical protein
MFLRLSMNWLASFWKALNTPYARGPSDQKATASQSSGPSAPPPFESFNSGESVRNFSPRAQQVLALSRKEADRFNHNFVGTEHLLLGLIRLGQGTAVKVLGEMGLNLESVRAEVEKQIGTGPDQKMCGNIPYTPRVKKVLSLAAKEARALNHTFVGTEHILLGLLREGDGVAARVLANLGVHAEGTRQQILKELNPNYSPALDAAPLPEHPKSQEPPRAAIDLSKRYDVFCREGDREVVCRNVRFKNVRTLLKQREDDSLCEYVELEQENGQIMFVARWHLTRFCEHDAKPPSDKAAGENQ